MMRIRPVQTEIMRPVDSEVLVTVPGTQIVSSGETNAVQKILEAPVGTKRIEARPQQDSRVKSLFKAFFEPIHGLVVIPHGCIDHGNLRSIRITSA
jgi:hypothetical protein